MKRIIADTMEQARMIGLVAFHDGGFATPTHHGAIWIYSLATRNGRTELVRDFAATIEEVRRILGY